jgi:hypothetical protein
MKKLILIILLVLSSCYADESVQGNRLNTITALIQKQDALASAIDMYISLYGTIPGSITALKTAEVLDPAFTYTGTFSVNGVGKAIVLSDTVSPVTTYQQDFYLKTNDQSKASTHTVAGSTFTASYPFTSKATFSYFASSSITVSPKAPSSPAMGSTWLNSLTNQIYYYSGGWISVNPRKLWIVRDVAELPTSATVNDGAIVLTTSSLTKYLYNGTSWITIPQTIPFTLNGAF